MGDTATFASSPSARTIRLSKEQRIRILNSRDLYTIMQAVFLREQKIDRDREHFWIMGLAPRTTPCCSRS